MSEPGIDALLNLVAPLYSTSHPGSVVYTGSCPVTVVNTDSCLGTVEYTGSYPGTVALSKVLSVHWHSTSGLWGLFG